MIKSVIKISRSTISTKQTLGTFQIVNDDIPVLNGQTLELKWLNNQTGISCIPVGEYEWKKVGATKNIPYEHILILDVEGRSGICIHKANYFSQLRGCIAPGDKHIDINNDGEKDVRNSGFTFDKIMAIVPEKGKLIIT